MRKRGGVAEKRRYVRMMLRVRGVSRPRTTHIMWLTKSFKGLPIIFHGICGQRYNSSGGGGRKGRKRRVGRDGGGRSLERGWRASVDVAMHVSPCHTLYWVMIVDFIVSFKRGEGGWGCISTETVAWGVVWVLSPCPWGLFVGILLLFLTPFCCQVLYGYF